MSRHGLEQAIKARKGGQIGAIKDFVIVTGKLALLDEIHSQNGHVERPRRQAIFPRKQQRVRASVKTRLGDLLAKRDEINEHALPAHAMSNLAPVGPQHRIRVLRAE